MCPILQTVEGQILEKPQDKQDAYRMLSRWLDRAVLFCILGLNCLMNDMGFNDDCGFVCLSCSLSGKEHSVFTGVAIVLCQEKEGWYSAEV